jgi:hypothetical protein
MDWQQVVALLIVAGTAGLMCWSRVRRRRFNFQAHTHCGCAAGMQSGPPGSIVFRARKGERPEVLVKMK